MSKRSLIPVSLIAIVILAAWGLSNLSGRSAGNISGTSPGLQSEVRASAAVTAPRSDGELTVAFIDVGQGDAILIRTPAGKYVLIDAGPNASADKVVQYIAKNTGGRLDAVVGTHPHEDHIGGLDKVINSFDIGDIYMPKVTSTTKTFEDVLLAVKNKGKTVKTAKSGVTIDVDPAVSLTVLSPVKDTYDSDNRYSVVIKLVYGNTSWLFEADAETLNETEMLASGASLTADVLKVAHHGSSYASSAAFLNAVKPRYAIISVAADNSYGHPAQDTLSRLIAAGAKIFRTDISGTIIGKSDGENVSILAGG